MTTAETETWDDVLERQLEELTSIGRDLNEAQNFDPGLLVQHACIAIYALKERLEELDLHGFEMSPPAPRRSTCSGI